MALVVASAQDGSSAVSPMCHQGRKAYVLFFLLSFPSSSCAEVKVDRRLQTAELLFRLHTQAFSLLSVGGVTQLDGSSPVFLFSLVETLWS